MAESLLDMLPGVEEELEKLTLLERSVAAHGALRDREREELTRLILGVEAAVQVLE